MMTLKNARVLLNTLVTVMLITAGCGTEDTTSQTVNPENETSESGEDTYPQYTAKYLDENGRAVNERGTFVLKLLEEQFQKLDWTNPAIKPFFSVDLEEGHFLGILLSENSTADEIEYAAIWKRPGPEVAGATTTIIKRSKPFKDEVKALAILHSFGKGENDFKAAVEWEENEATIE